MNASVQVYGARVPECTAGCSQCNSVGVPLQGHETDTKEQISSRSALSPQPRLSWRERTATLVRVCQVSLCCFHPESINIQDDVSPPHKHYDRLAAVVAILLFFVVLFVFAVFET